MPALGVSHRSSYTCTCCGRRGARFLIRLPFEHVRGLYVEPVIAFCPLCDQGEPTCTRLTDRKA